MDGPIPCRPRPCSELFKCCDPVPVGMFRPRTTLSASLPERDEDPGRARIRLHRPSPTIYKGTPRADLATPIALGVGGPDQSESDWRIRPTETSSSRASGILSARSQTSGISSGQLTRRS